MTYFDRNAKTNVTNYLQLKMNFLSHIDIDYGGVKFH